jgi:hypothetical protein
MTKEYHVYTDKGPTHEQMFIFEVDRKDNRICFDELWICVEGNNGNLRTRVQLGKMIETIIDNEGGDVLDQDINKIVEVFRDILPQEKQDELEQDELDRDQEKIFALDPNILIKLSESINNDELENVQEKFERITRGEQ